MLDWNKIENEQQLKYSKNETEWKKKRKNALISTFNLLVPSHF
jgi:hypothetical protein